MSNAALLARLASRTRQRIPVFVPSQLETFFYWIRERHAIYERRQVGQPWPWTEDEILRKYRFTNPFRTLDRVTKDLFDRLDPHLDIAPLDLLLFNICLFRIFNLTATYDALGGWRRTWNADRAERILALRVQRRERLFTGAYIVMGGGSGVPKYVDILRSCTHIWNEKDRFVREIRTHRSIEQTVRMLCEIKYVGGFVAYEFATDFRHTRLLDDAVDIMTWANPGPGARRGLNRLTGYRLAAKRPVSQMQAEMRHLLEIAPNRLGRDFPRLEMRDIEHSLCEFDKYQRVHQGEDRTPKKRFRPFVP